MQIKKSSVLSLVSKTVLGLSCLALLSASPALAQGPSIPEGVSMTMYRLNQAQDGRQFFVNNNNQQVYLPGIGAVGQDIPIYTGPKGGVWYVDRNNKPNQISAATQMGSVQSGQPVTNNYYQQPTGSSGGSAMGAAAVGAAAGSMMGAAMYNNQYPAYGAGTYHGVPYGAAMYYDNNNKPYYMNNGTKAYVNNDVTVNNAHFNNWQNQAAVYDKHVVNPNGEWHGAYGQAAGYNAPYGGIGAANAYQNNQQQQNAQAAAHGAEASNAYHNNQQQQNVDSAARGAEASNAYRGNQQQQNAESAAHGAEASNAYRGNQQQQNADSAAKGAAAARGSDGEGGGRFGGGDGGGRFGGGDGGGRFGGAGGGGRFGGGRRGR